MSKPDGICRRCHLPARSGKTLCEYHARHHSEDECCRKKVKSMIPYKYTTPVDDISTLVGNLI